MLGNGNFSKDPFTPSTWLGPDTSEDPFTRHNDDFWKRLRLDWATREDVPENSTAAKIPTVLGSAAVPNMFTIESGYGGVPDVVAASSAAEYGATAIADGSSGGAEAGGE